MAVRLIPPSPSLVTPVLLTPISPDAFLDWFDLSSRPLLAFARRAVAPASSVMIEWIADSFKGGRLTHCALHNYTQILRQPFRRKFENGVRETLAQAAKRAGDQILDDAEKVLWYSKPQVFHSGGHPVSTCGGVLHYLGRRVYENDAVTLRELSPLKLYMSRGERDAMLPEEEHTHEWIWEFSLQVNPGHYKRGMKPLFLPPEQKPVKPWPQGVSLDHKESRA